MKIPEDLKLKLGKAMDIDAGGNNDDDDDDAMGMEKTYIIPSFRPKRQTHEEPNQELDKKFVEFLVADLIAHNRRVLDYEDWYDEELQDLIVERLNDMAMAIVDDSVRRGIPFYCRDELLQSDELFRCATIIMREYEKRKKELEKDKEKDFFAELDEIEMELD